MHRKPNHRKPNHRNLKCRNAIRRAVTIVVVTVVVSVVALMAAATPAMAAPAPPPAVNDLGTVIDNLRFWIMSVIGAVATLFLCIGGARYMMAGGDPTQIERAKGSFRSAGIGYGLALLAPVLLTILNSILVK
jgi:hypothetical protein